MTDTWNKKMKQFCPLFMPQGPHNLEFSGVWWTVTSLSICNVLRRLLGRHVSFSSNTVEILRNKLPFPWNDHRYRGHALTPNYHLTVNFGCWLHCHKIKMCFSPLSFHSASCVSHHCPQLHFCLHISTFPLSMNARLFGELQESLSGLADLLVYWPFILTHAYYAICPGYNSWKLGWSCNQAEMILWGNRLSSVLRIQEIHC